MTRYVIAEQFGSMWPFSNVARIDLPPGHHHVHVGEDGTITAVPLVPYSMTFSDRHDAWVDAKGETP